LNFGPQIPQGKERAKADPYHPNIGPKGRESKRKRRIKPMGWNAEKAGKWRRANLRSEGGLNESFWKKKPGNGYTMNQRIEDQNPRLGAG